MSKILIIDDDEGLRQIYSRYLNAEGFTVLETGSADKALDFSGEGPGIILLDLQLPVIEGQGLMAALRQSYPQAKVIIFSCYDIPFQKKTVPNADDYFNKTEGCRALSSKIRTVLA